MCKAQSNCDHVFGYCSFSCFTMSDKKKKARSIKHTMFGAGITKYKRSQIHNASKNQLVVNTDDNGSTKKKRRVVPTRQISLDKALAIMSDQIKTSPQRIKHTYRFTSVSKETAALFDKTMAYAKVDLEIAVLKARDADNVFHYKQALSNALLELRNEIGIPSDITDLEMRENVICTWSFFSYLHEHGLKHKTSVSHCTNCGVGVFVLERTAAADEFNITCNTCASKLLPPLNKSEKTVVPYKYPWKTSQVIELFEQIDMLHGPSKSVVSIKQGPSKLINVETTYFVLQCREEVIDKKYGPFINMLHTTPLLTNVFLFPADMVPVGHAPCLHSHFRNHSVTHSV